MARPVDEPTPVRRIDDPGLLLDLACQHEKDNLAAVRMGLPAVGSKLVNKYGLEFVVEGHVHLATADTCQRWREGGGCIDDDLYPSIIPQNMSDRFTEFIATVDQCTPKTFLILDTVPHIRRGTNVPGGNYIDTAGHPNMNLVFLDAARVHETVFAHEIGHAWVQFVDQIEDMRTMKDVSVPQRVHQLTHVQSFVSDLRVNELLVQKGFDLSPIVEDRIASIESLGRAIQVGYQPEHKREEVFIALMLASEILERESSDSKMLAKLNDSLMQVSKMNPKIVAMAEGFADAVQRNGYRDKESFRTAIDECLVISFEHSGDPLDFENDLVVPPDEEVLLDKCPDWFSGAPMEFKCEVGRTMAKNNVPYDSGWSILSSEYSSFRIQFESKDGRTFGPFAIEHPHLDAQHRHIEFINQQNRRHNEQTMNKANPVSSPMPRAPQFPRPIQPPKPPTPGAPFQPPMPPPPGQRFYMPGLARFLTQVMIERQLEGEHPYSYAFNNPTTYVDPDGNRPQKGIPKRYHTTVVVPGVIIWDLPFNLPPYIQPGIGWSNLHLGYGNYCGGDRNPLAECPPLHLPPPTPWDNVDACCVAHDAGYNKYGCDWLHNVSAQCRAVDAALCDCLKREKCQHHNKSDQDDCNNFRNDGLLWFCNTKPHL